MLVTQLKNATSFLNQEGIKEPLKIVFGSMTFIFGVLEIYHEANECYRSLTGKVKVMPLKEPSTWTDTALKVTFLFARIAIVTSTFTSPPGLSIISVVAKKCFTANQLIRFFGPNLNFVSTPYHPRHIVSITACLLGIPETIKMLWNLSLNKPEKEKEHPDTLLSEREIQVINTWNTVTSRPSLHFFNYLFRQLLRRA